MKLWIRVDAASPRDPKIGNLASELGVHRTQALGLAVAVWCAMSEHAVDGCIGKVSDATLEEWAGWSGRRGRFATAFRSLFTDADGVVAGWSDRQGKLLDRMERDRQRHRKFPPKQPPPSEEPPRNIGGTSAETPVSLHGKSTSTERNGTVRKDLKASDAVASDPKNWPAEAADLWRAKVGDVTPGHVGKALSRCYEQHGWETLRSALVEYIETPSNRPKKLEWFAQDIVRWIAESKEPLVGDGGVLTAKGRRFMGVAS